MDKLHSNLEYTNSTQTTNQFPCTFCLKPAFILPNKLESRFLNCLSQFLEKFPATKYNSENQVFQFCTDCQKLVNLFCEQYYQWQCLKLRTYWTLERLVKIINLAVKVPSRLLQAKFMFDEIKTSSKSSCTVTPKDTCGNNKNSEYTFESFQNLQRDFVKKCGHKLAGAYPRVYLMDIKAPTINESVSITTMKQDCDSFVSSPALAYFFGWIFTNAAVLLLAATFTGVDQHAILNYGEEPFEIPVTDEISVVDDDSVSSYSDSTALSDFSLLPESQTVNISEYEVKEQVTRCEIASTDDNPKCEHISTKVLAFADEIPVLFTPEERNDDNDNRKEEVDVKPELKPEQSAQKFSCVHGDKSVKNKFALKRHSKRVNSKAPTRSYKCKICNKSFSCYKNLRRHKLHSNVHMVVKRSLQTETRCSRKLGKQPDEETTQLESFKTKQSILTKVSRKDEIDKNASKSLESFPAHQSETNTKNTHNYSLRANRKRSYKTFVNLDCESDVDYKLEHNSSSSSENEDTSFDNEQKVLISSKINHNKFQIQTKKSIKRAFGTFICPLSDCSMKFRFERNLNEHKKLHGSFKCNFCSVVKEYAPDLALHELEHPKPTLLKSGQLPKNPILSRWKCFRCFKKSRTKLQYVRHFLCVHLSLKSDKSETCSICKISYKKHKQHHRTHHEKKDGDLSDFKTCHLCPAYFVTSCQLFQHLCRFHWQGKCPECEENFSRREDSTRKFVTHLEQFHPQHLPELKFICENNDCFRRFSTQAELDGHYLLHQKRTNNYTSVKCSQCTKQFKTKFGLYKHVNDVHVPHTYVCDECGKSFKTKVGLSLHMEYHKDPKDWQWQCSECGKKCATKQKLDQHKRTHTKEKPFICQYCGDKYAHRHNWRNHMKTKHPDKEDNASLQAPMKGKYMSRKGSKKGECIMAGTSQK